MPPISAITDRKSFAALLDEIARRQRGFEGSVLKGSVIAIENDFAVIDVGLKTEGRIPLKEFASPAASARTSRSATWSKSISSASKTRNGEAVLSREKARREEAWTAARSSASRSNQRVNGVIFGRVKGGFTVDLDGAVAFLPGSQVDIRPVRDVGPLMGTPQPFQILKMDRARGNIVVSRRAVLEESRAEAAHRTGRQPQGRPDPRRRGQEHHRLRRVRRSRRRRRPAARHRHRLAAHQPSVAKCCTIGETVKVQVIRINPETQRISLGMKQLEADPWEGVDAKYPVGAKFKGRVTNITDYGAFVELEPGVEGLVHVSEMSWTKKNVHPGKIVSTSQEVEVMVLDVDPAEAPHLARPQAVPGQSVGQLSPRSIRSAPSSKARSRTSPSSACSSACPASIDGMVHLSDLAWDKPGEEAIADLQEGRHGQGEGARRRRREGAHLPRHQAARRTIRSPRPATI